MMRNTRFFELLGIDQIKTSHFERLISAAGAFVSILFIILVSHHYLGYMDGQMIVASMGASAVLLFAVPHGPLSQPWHLVGGHSISAVVGVSCAMVIPNELLAASLAVGLSVATMYYLRCIHPPGGATALTAVVAGDAVHAMGFQFVLTPVLINVVVILLVAIIFNALVPSRRYPAALHYKGDKDVDELQIPSMASISHQDFVYALSEIDNLIDISERDLIKIYDIATKQSQSSRISVENIKLGAAYSNGEQGDYWAVRLIVDESKTDDSVIYKVVAGHGVRTSACVSREEFSRWARYQMIREGEHWMRVDPR